MVAPGGRLRPPFSRADHRLQDSALDVTLLKLLVGLLEHVLVRVDLGGQRRGVADLERHVALPLGLEGRDVRDDAAARVGGLAHADCEDIARDLEVLHRPAQGKGVGGYDAHLSLVVHEGAGVEALRIDEGVVDVREDLELVGDPEVIAVGRHPVRDHPRADLALLEGLDHVLLERHPPDPAIALDHRLALLDPRPWPVMLEWYSPSFDRVKYRPPYSR